MLDKVALKKSEEESDAIQIQQKFCERLLTGKDAFEAHLKMRNSFSSMSSVYYTGRVDPVVSGTEMKYEFDQFEEIYQAYCLV